MYNNQGFSDAYPDILLLFGTQTGNAETVAEHLADTLESSGFTVHLVDMMDAYPELLAAYRQIIICTSTWGDGELPDNAVDLYEGLARYQTDLSQVVYGIVALGDHAYDPHFCAGGLLFSMRLTELGARQVLDRFEINVGPEDEDLKGAHDWALDCAAAFASWDKDDRA
jgi:flavodoxin